MSAGGLGARASRHWSSALLPAALGAAALLLACAPQERAWPLLGGSEAPASEPWSGYENEGPLPVADAETDAPGPAIYRHVARQPSLAGFLREQGPPASLEVARREGEPLRVLLSYPEREGDCRIRLERAPGGDGRWSASLPNCPSARRAAPPPQRRAPEPAAERESERKAEPAPESEPSPAAEGASRACSPPTSLQRLECPIDPEREDCAALCRCDDGLEWCE